MDSQELILSHKKLTNLPDEIPNTIPSHMIRRINAGNNKINKLSSFKRFTNLQILNLSHNSTGICFKSLNFVLDGLENLQSLNLASNQIYTLGEHVFSKCIQIRNLDLSDNKLQSTLRCLTYLHQLQILDLQSNLIDNICQFKPLRSKLPNLICIKLKGNSMENQYQNSYEEIVQRDYFPSVEFVVTKYTRFKDKDIIARVEERSQQQNLTELSLSSSEMGDKRQKKVVRSLSTNLPPNLQPIIDIFLVPNLRERHVKQQPIQTSKFEQVMIDCVDNDFIPTFNRGNFHLESSAIKEEYSQENSHMSFLSPQDNLHQFFESPDMSVTFKNQAASCPNNKFNSIERGQSFNKSNASQKSQTSDQKIERLISQGNLKKEVTRLQGILLYKQKELIKVDNSIQDEKRQSQQLLVLCQSFEELVKLTLGIDSDLNVNFFEETIKKLKQFTQTIDIFTSEKVRQLIFETIQPLLNNNYHELDQKMVGIQCVIDKLKKCAQAI